MFTRDTKVERLRHVPLFAECSKRELQKVASTADEIHFPAGRTLITEGAAAREFILILSGDVEVRRGGRRIALKGDGNAFGEVALLTGKPRNATVVTTSPTVALVITDRAFRRLLDEMPSIQRKLLASLAARMPSDD